MTTVTTYMVRKPTDLNKVIQMSRKYGQLESETVVIAETIALDEPTYKAVTAPPRWLTGISWPEKAATMTTGCDRSSP